MGGSQDEAAALEQDINGYVVMSIGLIKVNNLRYQDFAIFRLIKVREGLQI